MIESFFDLSGDPARTVFSIRWAWYSDRGMIIESLYRLINLQIVATIIVRRKVEFRHQAGRVGTELVIPH
jgi:hypothetical protein